MEYTNFILEPNIQKYPGIRVTKDTEIVFENEHVTQSIKDLVLKSTTKVIGDDYESIYYTTIKLHEGDVLIFEDDSRGYVKPVEHLMDVKEAIELLNDIKE